MKSRLSDNSRTHNSIRNIIWGNIGSGISLLLQFASRTVFNYTIGVTYLGINGLFTGILGVLSFAELGIGTAMNYSLYHPIAVQDTRKTQALIYIYKKAYRWIALSIAIFGLVLIPFLKIIIKGSEDIDHLYLYYVMYLFNTVTSYFITYKYSYVTAAQQHHLLTRIDIIGRIVTVALQMVSLIIFRNFLFYLVIHLVCLLVQRIIADRIINRRYPILSHIESIPLEPEERSKLVTNVKALMVHKFGDISVNQTDNIIISAAVNIATTGLVSNYTLLITSVSSVLNIFFNGITASLGNLIALESKDKQKTIFDVYQFLGFWMYGFTTVCFITLTQPFIQLWIGPNKLIDNFSLILILINQYLVGQRVTINNFKIAGGVFKDDRFIPLIQAIVNLVISIVMVLWIGLPGIFVGTVASSVIASVWRPIIVYRTLFNQQAKPYFLSFAFFACITVFASVLMAMISRTIMSRVDVPRFALLFVITVAVTNLIFYGAFRHLNSFAYLKMKGNELIRAGRMNNA